MIERETKARGVAMAVGLALGAALAGAAHAHHSFAMYDQSKTVTVTGKLTRFIPGANHAQLLFELVDEHGKVEVGPDGQNVIWGVELGPAATIAKQGVTVQAFPLGTVLSVTLNPLRNGKNFGALASGAQLVKCGMSVPKGGCNEKNGEKFLESREGFGTQRVQAPQPPAAPQPQ
jgi:Family of unknown function (DUF6152)